MIMIHRVSALLFVLAGVSTAAPPPLDPPTPPNAPSTLDPPPPPNTPASSPLDPPPPPVTPAPSLTTPSPARTIPAPPPINFEAAYAEGVNAFVVHRYVLAEQCFEDAVQVANEPAAWMLKGLSERALGKHAEAQESIHQAASLFATGVAGRISLSRAMERVQGDFRLYIDDVEKYYVRTGLTPGEVIAGAEAPIGPAVLGPAEPTVPVPPKPYSPPPPAPAIESPETTPPAPANAPVQTPPGEPRRVTVAKPVVVVESSPGVPAVIAAAPVYPLPGVAYAADRWTSVVSGGGYAGPVPVKSCCVGVGAWLPGSWSGYVYPYYGYYGYSWPSSNYRWWDGYPYASSW
jgi:hypothetical protein